MPALHTPLPSVASEQFVDLVAGKVNISVLPSGLKVASVDNGGNLSTVGVFLNAGSRDEDNATRGSSLLLRHLALKSTQARSGFRLIRELERMGANVAANAHHEMMSYSGDVLRPKALDLVRSLSEALLYPALHPWEVKEAAALAIRESEQLAKNPPAIITEFMHTAAFHGVGLGQQLYGKKTSYEHLDPDAVGTYLQNVLSQNSICVAGVNVDHAELVEVASSTFASVPETRSLRRANAEYVGGDFRTEAEGESTIVGLAFEGASWSSENIIHVSLLQSLMGGGSAFSAGGPGKGMLTRLYTNVLNRYHEVQSANMFNMFYSDSGIFGVYGETAGPLAGMLVDVLTNELRQMGGVINAEEFQRAKNQLKSSILMNVEQSHVLLDDIGRQTLILSKHHNSADLCAKIDAVTTAELTGVAQRLMKSPLTFVAYGDLQNVPRYEAVANRFK